MSVSNPCPGEDCTTLGVDARSLDAYGCVTTQDGEVIVFDRDDEDAWIQSDVYDELTEVV